MITSKALAAAGNAGAENTVLSRIRDLVSRAVTALVQAAEAAAEKDSWRTTTFCPLAVHGVDLVMDQSLHPWLVEVRVK